MWEHINCESCRCEADYYLSTWYSDENGLPFCKESAFRIVKEFLENEEDLTMLPTFEHNENSGEWLET